MNLLRRLFNRKPKGYTIDGKYEVVRAFDFEGQTYYMHKDPLNVNAGRGLTAMVFYEELLQRCTVDYLREHCAAVRAVFSDPKKIDLLQLAKLTTHLEERVNFLAAVPEHVYKLASVVFFTKHESPIYYDQKTGAEKVAKWKATEGMYDFFLRTPLRDLVPSLALPDQNSVNYLAVQHKIDEYHLKYLREVLSNKASTTDTLN